MSELCALVDAGIVHFYNEKRGLKLKWVFYIFYPLHLLILAGICVLGRVFGHGTMEFYPRMDAVFTGVSGAVLYIAFAVLALFPSILEMKEKLTWRCCGLTD